MITPGKWTIGYNGGITGPTSPAVRGATCEESVAYARWIDSIARGCQSKWSERPSATTLLVTVKDINDGGQMMSSCVAFFPARNGEAMDNAKLFVNSKELLAAVKDFLSSQSKESTLIAFIERAQKIVHEIEGSSNENQHRS